MARDHYRLVWAALTFTLQLPKPVSQPCVFQVVRVSGTIRKAEEEAIRRAQRGIRQVQRVAGVQTTDVASGVAAKPAGKVLEPMDDDGRFANGIDDLDEPGDEDDID